MLAPLSQVVAACEEWLGSDRISGVGLKFYVGLGLDLGFRVGGLAHLGLGLDLKWLRV